jgi:hypothetical protein
VPAPCHNVGSFFDTVVMIKAQKDQANLSLNVIKDSISGLAQGKAMDLDPATYLVKKA